MVKGREEEVEVHHLASELLCEVPAEGPDLDPARVGEALGAIAGVGVGVGAEEEA
jgi:hypothetical protein